MIHSFLIALLVLLALSLFAAVIGSLLAPKPLPDGVQVATRCAGESLDHYRSLEPSGGTGGMVAGRMYAAPPSASSPIFRRAL